MTNPRMTGDFGAKRRTFAEEFPSIQTLTVVVSILSPSKTDTNTYHENDGLPSESRRCRCGKGTFPIARTIRELINTGTVKGGGRCEGGTLQCSNCFSVTVEATHKPK